MVWFNTMKCWHHSSLHKFFNPTQEASFPQLAALFEWMMIFAYQKLYSRFFALLTLVVTCGCKTGYCSLRILISFVKLIVVININEQSNVRSQNGSCASNSALTLVFLNFLRFYCLPRSLESLYVSFPVLSNVFRGKLVVIHTAIVLFQKYHNTLCCPSKVLH